MDGDEVRVVAQANVAKPAWYEDITLDEAERFIESNLQAAARNVIAIGYYLKNIRDNELFREAGCESIWDYAQERFGFSKGTASRYMKRNDKFSRGGNSPILAEAYRDFSKSQLQEMLSLDDSQLEQVTPDMTVRQIRDMRRPAEKPVPYIALPGQIELADLLDDDVENAALYDIPAAPAACTIDVADMISEESVATSQQTGIVSDALQNEKQIQEECCEIAAEPLSAYGTPKRVYPPDSLIACEGCEGGHDCFSCAMDCRIRGKERYCMGAPLGNPFSCETVKYGFDGLPDTCQFINHDLAYHRAGDNEPDPCCKQCQDPCEYICWRAMKALEQQEESAPGKESNVVNNAVDNVVDAVDQESHEHDTPAQISYGKVRQVLEKEKSTLKQAEEAFAGEEMPPLYENRKIIVAALEMLLRSMEDAENTGVADPEPDRVQPELPAMKNNDQRKTFLDTFHDWPVWFEVPEASEVYYRYDLPDGCSLVICEYHFWKDWVVKFGYEGSPEATWTREYILIPGYHYLNDCQSNRTAMAEKLKEIQKK